MPVGVVGKVMGVGVGGDREGGGGGDGGGRESGGGGGEYSEDKMTGW